MHRYEYYYKFRTVICECSYTLKKTASTEKYAST